MGSSPINLTLATLVTKSTYGVNRVSLGVANGLRVTTFVTGLPYLKWKIRHSNGYRFSLKKTGKVASVFYKAPPSPRSENLCWCKQR